MRWKLHVPSPRMEDKSYTKKRVNTFSENPKKFIYVGATLSNEHCGRFIRQIIGPEIFSSVDIQIYDLNIYRIVVFPVF